MSLLNFTHLLAQTVTELSEDSSLKGLFHEHQDGDPLPSGKVLHEIIELCRAILFPGFYGKSTVNHHTITYHIGVNIERLYNLLTEQIHAGLCFDAKETGDCACDTKREKAIDLAGQFISRLPALREVLATDVEAAYNGDPAAESYGEIISCYPIIKALSNYRIAHELLLLGVPLIPRIITEMAHSETGIDIHPAARIGHHFTIDHGRRDRGHLHHRQPRKALSGSHARSQKLPARRRRTPHQGNSAPPDSGRRRDCLLQRHHSGAHHGRPWCDGRR